MKRWLAAPLQHADGTLQIRDRGTPQGSAISPVLANLFMHCAFDAWMVREYPTVKFERYADDAVVHCVTNRQANRLLVAIRDRMVEVGLRLHPAKTKIVYCQDGKRRLDHEHTDFTFLGFAFRVRAARGRNGETFTSFLPAMSKDASDEGEWSDPPVAAASTHRAFNWRTRTRDQSDRAWLDAVLRRVLPNGAATTPGAHQRLLDALDPQEVSTAAGVLEGQGVLAADDPPVPEAFRPLGLERRILVTKMTRAR